MAETRCGTSWIDANTNCRLSCKLWSDCPSGYSCYSGLASEVCLTANPALAIPEHWPSGVVFPPPGFPSGFPYPPGFATGSPPPAGWASNYPWPPPPPGYPWPPAGSNWTAMPAVMTASQTGVVVIQSSVAPIAVNTVKSAVNTKLPHSDSTTNSKADTTTIILGVVIGLSLLVIFAVLGVFWVRRRINKMDGIESGKSQLSSRDDDGDSIGRNISYGANGGGASAAMTSVPVDFSALSTGNVRYGELPSSDFIIAALLAAKNGTESVAVDGHEFLVGKE
ncbi:hypothetical protein BDR26DRAFT_849275 [Obelidium mucronatum]|nr:hypothetical protein BDR26DRAFT_849275 [Obelidium mucronatum]